MTGPAAKQQPIERKRLMWLCRRGIREMDVLLGDYVSQHYDTMDQQQLANLQDLLQQADLDILDWVYQRRQTPTQWQSIIKQLQQHNAK